MTPALCLLAAMLALPQDDDHDYELVPAFPEQAKFDKPLLLEHHATDPEVYYVVIQDGIIYRIPRDPESAERTTFLDWEERCHRENWEEGLLGLAFDPEHAENGYVYIYYSEEVGSGKRRSVISRLETRRGDGDPVAVPESELVLLTVDQPFGNHNGGTIVFGPDAMLYVALGDGGSAHDPQQNGQNLGTLLATVLRIDVREATAEQPYRVPPDNPFVDVEGARPEIWAYGLRNPWRLTFDRETGELWCADVGQNKFEEIDRVVKGGNYGWSYMEGKHEFERRQSKDPVPEDLIPPVLEYGRDEGLSATGGYVYRGRAMPELVGCYIYGDFVSGRVWAARLIEGEEPEIKRLCRTPAALASFAEEPDGELLLLCFDGAIYRLSHVEW